MRPQIIEENQKAFDYYAKLIVGARDLALDLVDADRNESLKANGVNGPENIPPVAIFRHFLNLVDSISILVKEGSGETPKFLLRPALEAFLYLDYIMRDNSLNRSLAYMVKEIHKEIRKIERIIEGNHIIRQKGYTGDLPFEGQEGIIAVNSKKNLLATTLYASIDSQFAAANKPQKVGSKERDVPWYYLDSKALNIAQLAEKMGYKHMYDVFYRKWSDGIHGSDLYLGKFLPISNGQETTILPIRYPKDIPIITEHTIKLTSKICEVYLNGRIPGRINDFKDKLNELESTWESLNQQNIDRL